MPSMSELEPAAQLTVVGILAAMIGLYVYGADRQDPEEKFHLAPRSAEEWITYWFHTLEFIVCACVLLARHPAFRYLPFDADTGVAFVSLSLPLLLLISSLVFWRTGSKAAKRGLSWTLLAVVGFLLIPALGCTR